YFANETDTLVGATDRLRRVVFACRRQLSINTLVAASLPSCCRVANKIRHQGLGAASIVAVVLAQEGSAAPRPGLPRPARIPPRGCPPPTPSRMGPGLPRPARIPPRGCP